jgi:hypothetical protein
MYLQINTIKYDTDREITNTYENLQIVRSQFFTDKLIFVYNKYSVLLEFLENSNSFDIRIRRQKKKIIAVTYN